jgi:hypothetical protein
VSRSGLSDDEERRYEALSADYERDPQPIDPQKALFGEAAATASRSLLEEALGGAEALERALGGRPSLSPQAPRGHRSPVRSLRLPEELSVRLDAQATAEGRRPSDVMRDALVEYLDGHRAG